LDETDEPIYSGRCRPAEPTPITHFAPGNYRFRVPDREPIHFNDLNLGPQSFTALAAPNPGAGAAHSFGDFTVWRKPASRRPLTSSPQNLGAPGASPLGIRDAEAGALDRAEMWDLGLPSYQLACVVDDAFQQITEVVRGADLLKSTARQLLLQRALSLPAPAYFHTRLLRDERGVRLAKRHDALAIHTLREQGMTAEEVLGRIADVEQTTRG
jgi:glutamyl-tRNA synthetase